jgi:hypothetical protein
MKLIACLIVLSLISTYWSTDLASPEASTGPEGHADCSSPTVPEQPCDKLRTTLHRDHPPIPLWWGWDMWAEWGCPSCRRRRRQVRRWHKHEPGRLERLRRKFRRWRRRWQRRWRQWRELVDDTVPAKATVPNQSTVCAGKKQATTVPAEAGERIPVTQVPMAKVVEEVSPTTRRGPGRPRTIPTAHKCCPSEGCLAYGRFGDDPIHDIVGDGTYTTVHGEVR